MDMIMDTINTYHKVSARQLQSRNYWRPWEDGGGRPYIWQILRRLDRFGAHPEDTAPAPASSFPSDEVSLRDTPTFSLFKWAAGDRTALVSFHFTQLERWWGYDLGLWGGEEENRWGNEERLNCTEIFSFYREVEMEMLNLTMLLLLLHQQLPSATNSKESDKKIPLDPIRERVCNCLSDSVSKIPDAAFTFSNSFWPQLGLCQNIHILNIMHVEPCWQQWLKIHFRPITFCPLGMNFTD